MSLKCTIFPSFLPWPLPQSKFPPFLLVSFFSSPQNPWSLVSPSIWTQQLSHKCSDSLFLLCHSPSRKPIAVCVLAKSPQLCLFAIPWTVACQAPLSMGFSRQEYWSGMPCPTPGHLPNPGIEPASLMSPELSDRFFTICCVRLQISLLKFLRVYAEY